MIAIWSSSLFALTLEDIRNELSGSAERDTLELKGRTTISGDVGTQVVNMHMVKKGTEKIYFEINSSSLNQRSIVSGDRIQITDLSTGEAKVLPYKGNELDLTSTGAPNPLATGYWSEPVLVSGSVYSLSNDEMEVFYNAEIHKVVQIKQNAAQGVSSEVFINYDQAGDELKNIRTTVIAQGKKTEILMEFLEMGNANNFPDRFFDF
jgi:hypothetical protein